jgi:DNA-binding XRE family transcriptional regulator
MNRAAAVQRRAAAVVAAQQQEQARETRTEFFRRRRAAHAERKRLAAEARKLTPETKAKISAARRAAHRASVLADPNTPLVKRLRVGHDWTLHEAAAHAGVSRRSWCRVEAGQPVNAQTTAHIARALGIGPGVLR